MIGLAILEIFDIVMAGLKVAKAVREEAPEIYDAIQRDQTHRIHWNAALLPDIPDEPLRVSDLMTHLQQMLLVHEGFRLTLYADTVGKWTIGCGRNLSDRGLRHDEAMLLLAHDMEDTMEALMQALPWVSTLSPVRQAVLADMAFNMGLGNSKRGLLSFKTTLQLIERRAYNDAATAMLKSKWAKQVKSRAVRLAAMMASDQWPTDIPG